MAFPITATVPSYYVVLRSLTRQSHVYYTSETGRAIDCRAWTSNGAVGAATQAFTGSYYIRDYYGNQVATGTLNAALTVPIPDGLPCGGYRIYLTQSVNDATYGYSGGAGSFLVVNDDARFPTMIGVPPTDTGRHGALRDDCFMHGITMMGPRRDTDDDPTNSAFTTNIHTGRSIDTSWYNNPSYNDPARPRPAFTLSTNLITGKETAWQTVVGDFYDNYGVTWFEGPANEPGGNASTVSSELQAFSQQTKAARPGAKVMGPCPVTFNNYLNQPGTGYWTNVLNDIAAMNPLPIDGISFHGYNCLNGDLSLGRKAYQGLVDTITAAGLQNLPRWHTEQGYPAAERGAFMPRLQGRWTMLMFLLEEQFGIPKEHHALFFDSDTGDYSVPLFYGLGDKSWTPAVAMLRAYSAEIWGKTFASAIDFGTPGNDMLLGNLYTGGDGTGLLAFQAAGSTDLSVTLNVSGTSSLTTVDCFGNTSTVTVTGGVATVPVTVEPVYVRLPAGVSATVSHEWNSDVLGGDLVASATASASGPSGATQAYRMNSVNQISTYYNNQEITSRSQTNAPYIDDTNAYPAWARFDWSSPKTLNRVVVFATPPWQAQGTLLDFDVQWLDADGVTWHTAKTTTEKAQYGPPSDATSNVLGHVAQAVHGGCTVESYFSDRWVFPVKLASKVTTKAIRIYVRNATYGMDATLEAKTAKGSADTTTFGNNFTIRSVQAFNSIDPNAPRRFLVRHGAFA